MKKWNDNFNNKRMVNGKIITIGEQDFIDNSIKVKEKNGNIICCPMLFDEEGNIYFIYNGMGVYVSDYMGNFEI